MKSFLKNKFKPFIRYVIIGILITFFDLTLVYILKEFLYFNVILAAGIAFIIANFTSFLLNKWWTFENRDKQVLRQYFKFLFTASVGLCLTIFFMWLFYKQLNLFSSITKKNYLICKIVISGIIVIWNFLINTFWTFSPVLKLKFSFDKKNKKYLYFLSVVVPAYNESKRIIKTIEIIIKYLNLKKFKWEIIIIDDGSSDMTYNVLMKKYKKNKNIRILRNLINQGKGYSVKQGVLNSSGKYILFTDADNSTPIEELDKLLHNLSDNNILIGSRYKKSEEVVIKKQPLYRIVISRIGNYLIKLFLLLDIEDTQCGFKLFPNEIAYYLFGLQTINRFGFDMEILTLATLSNIKIKEIPVNWFDSELSRIRPIKDAFITFLELLKIKLNIWFKYYQKKLNIVNKDDPFTKEDFYT